MGTDARERLRDALAQWRGATFSGPSENGYAAEAMARAIEALLAQPPPGLPESGACSTMEQWFLDARSTAHWIDLVVRYDGQEHRCDASWLKQWQPKEAT